MVERDKRKVAIMTINCSFSFFLTHSLFRSLAPQRYGGQV